MINVKDFYDALRENGVDFFCGVPDSLLKSFCAYVATNAPSQNHVITANEGAAIALAAGYHIGTGKPALVYMQNSGLGNAVNPLLSLADKEVYSIPLILLIGWRGEPNIKDEPQHIKQGKVTLKLLEAMDIEYSIVDDESDSIEIIRSAVETSVRKSMPYAIVVKKNSFANYCIPNDDSCIKPDLTLTREEALRIVIDSFPMNSIVVSTTGMLSRELFELREEKKEVHNHDFLTVGSMGHTSQIALGISLANPTKNVYCLDGDGGVLMHMGSYAVLGSLKPLNLKTILFNNGAHDSVGGQPTIGFQTDFQNIFKGFGFSSTFISHNTRQLKDSLIELNQKQGPCFLEIRVKKGARANLGRPTQSPLNSKQELMTYILNK